MGNRENDRVFEKGRACRTLDKKREAYGTFSGGRLAAPSAQVVSFLDGRREADGWRSPQDGHARNPRSR